MARQAPVVGVVMGSDSDWSVMRPCLDRLAEFGIACEVRVLSAHRTPEALEEYVRGASGRGIKVIVAAAGMSAALPGAVAARTALPVIGVAVPAGPLAGVDALLAIVQMPPGVPVGCVGIGEVGAVNAAVYAAEILAASDAALGEKVRAFQADQSAKTVQKDRTLRDSLGR